MAASTGPCSWKEQFTKGGETELRKGVRGESEQEESGGRWQVGKAAGIHNTKCKRLGNLSRVTQAKPGLELGLSDFKAYALN